MSDGGGVFGCVSIDLRVLGSLKKMNAKRRERNTGKSQTLGMRRISKGIVGLIHEM